MVAGLLEITSERTTVTSIAAKAKKYLIKLTEGAWPVTGNHIKPEHQKSLSCCPETILLKWGKINLITVVIVHIQPDRNYFGLILRQVQRSTSYQQYGKPQPTKKPRIAPHDNNINHKKLAEHRIDIVRRIKATKQSCSLGQHNVIDQRFMSQRQEE
ncbi:uncharacterized protein A4U43_C05F35500 [Asparagus officinalis]|uniref:Uncharacterized protein n=1 Tax=Asparagus officinalis TaxID=4686 RepID=A0A5P1EX28_ASPOF|nr:uncharacterized protein A4U43_C05F35500 [Asparagus officinalis]